MFDPAEHVINGVQIAVLLFGLVEFLKAQVPAIEGKVAQWIAFILGIGLFLLYRGLPFIPEPTGMWIGYAVEAVAFTLATSGYYKFVKGAIS